MIVLVINIASVVNPQIWLPNLIRNLDTSKRSVVVMPLSLASSGNDDHDTPFFFQTVVWYSIVNLVHHRIHPLRIIFFPFQNDCHFNQVDTLLIYS